MRIDYYSREYLSLWVEGDNDVVYEYEWVPASYVREIRALIKAGAEGKAWQVLRRFRVRKKGVRIRV